MAESNFKGDWENLAKSYRMIVWQLKASLKEIYVISQSNNSPEERVDRIVSLVRASGTYINDQE